MSAPGRPGLVQNLNDGTAEALQALLGSLSPGDSSVENGQKMTQDQVKKISDKLGELLGDNDIRADAINPKRNEKGELLNEEGLPIVDIVEPVTATPSTVTSGSAHIFDDPDLLPFWALSPAEKARRRAERERILDLLEQEERIEQEREEVAARERWQAELEKRKEAAKAELDALRKAKELQKKMGKALLRNVIEAKERDEGVAQRQREEEQEQEQGRKVKPKKSVAFADSPPDNDQLQDESESQWGDVSLARLQRKGKATLLTKAQMDKQPMKMEVVERHPTGLHLPQSVIDTPDPDSDDESEPGSPVPADSDEGEAINLDRLDDEFDEVRPSSPLSDSNSSGTEHMSGDDEPIHWQEDDFDFAQHQREIALAYYEKRTSIGAEVSSAMRAHTHDEPENEWDQPEVPLDATLASGPPKPAASRFRNERTSSTLASHSLGPSVLPSSQSSTLKGAVRMGKIEDGQLVGESDDDNEREAREIIELLTRGEATNLGPQPSFQPGQTTDNTVPSRPAVSSMRPAASTAESQAAKPASAEEAPAPTQRKPPKVSKFKLALAQPREQQSFGQPSPAMDTPVSTIERSSPKLSSGPGTPISVPSSSSRLPGPILMANPASHVPPSQRRPPNQAQMQSIIVESPSFRPPSLRNRPTLSTASPPVSSSNVISSHLPVSPQSASTLVDSPSFQSAIIDSPSFQGSAFLSSSTSLPTPPDVSTPATADNGHSVENDLTGKPAVVMSAEVKESNPIDRRTGSGISGREKKVSRFLAEREDY